MTTAWRKQNYTANYFLSVCGFGDGAGLSGPTVQSIWTHFQAKPWILEPFGNIFGAPGPGCNFGRDLTSPVAASRLAASAFLNENGHPWIRQALLLLISLPQPRFLVVTIAYFDYTSPVLLCTVPAGAFMF